MSEQEHAGVVRTTQVIVLALCGGVVMFAVVAALATGPGQQAQAGLMTMVSAAYALVASTAAALVPPLAARHQCRRIADGTWRPPSANVPPQTTDAGRLAVVHASKTILGTALLESAALFALVAYLWERHLAALGLAGVLVLAMLWHLPTPGSVSRWIGERLVWIEQQRQFSR